MSDRADAAGGSPPRLGAVRAGAAVASAAYALPDATVGEGRVPQALWNGHGTVERVGSDLLRDGGARR